MTNPASSGISAHLGPVDFFSSPAAPWVFLTGLPKFGIRQQRAVRSATPVLTDVLAMNAATLKALGFSEIGRAHV